MISSHFIHFSKRISIGVTLLPPTNLLLLILDLANNHNGSIEHGKRIIAEVANLNNPQNSFHPFQIAVTFSCDGTG